MPASFRVSNLFESAAEIATQHHLGWRRIIESDLSPPLDTDLVWG
jgi:hypothetical protein